MVELNEKAVALAPSLARFGLDAIDLDMLARGDMLGSTGAKVFNALVALSAIPAPDDGLVERLLEAADVLSQSAADLPVELDAAGLKKASIDIASEMPLGRMDRAHAVAHKAVIAYLRATQSKDEQIERLMRIIEVMGKVSDEKSLATDAAEQQAQKLTAENERLRKAALAIATGSLSASDAAYVAAVALETQEGGK